MCAMWCGVLRQLQVIYFVRSMNIVIISLAIVLITGASFVHSVFKIGSLQSRAGANMANDGTSYPVYIEDDVMRPKKHGTCDKPVMHSLRWGCDYDTADRISCFNRHYAERSGYWESTDFLKEVRNNKPKSSHYRMTTPILQQ